MTDFNYISSNATLSTILHNTMDKCRKSQITSNCKKDPFFAGFGHCVQHDKLISFELQQKEGF